MNRYFLNPTARSTPTNPGLFDADDYRQVSGFFHIQPTPLWHLPGLASAIGVSVVLVKDESARMGLNAFKILGVSYAVSRLLSEGRVTPGSVLVCATEGNHGRAVARVARENALRAKVYMAANANASRVAAIAKEDAEIVLVDGNYDDAVRLSADEARLKGWTIISDTAWPGYEEIPRLIMAGYTRIMDEAEAQWSPEPPPDVVLIQAGVGGLACAVLSWLSYHFGARRPFTIVCEPASAACHLESARAGQPVSLSGPFNTIMAGLRSGEVSHLAWPAIFAAADAFVPVNDEQCLVAMKVFAHPINGDAIITTGAAGACGLAALLALHQDETLQPVRDASGLTSESRVLVINTESSPEQGFDS